MRKKPWLENYPSDVRGSDQWGTAFIALGKTIMELYKFIKKRRTIRGMIRSIWLAYSKAQEEVKAASEKKSQATPVSPAQNTKKENPAKRPREQLNESTTQLTKRYST